jgi:hypothetical protein
MMKLRNLFESDTRPPGDPFAREEPDACCGRHAFCQKELLLKSVSDPVEYYDDEELDALAGRSSASYDDEETGRFADILHTMLETDVAGWIDSLQRRGIELPDDLKEDVLMLINKP